MRRAAPYSIIAGVLLSPLAALAATPSCSPPAGCCKPNQPKVVVHYVECDDCNKPKKHIRDFVHHHVCCADEPPRGEVVEAVGLRRTPANLRSEDNFDLRVQPTNKPAPASLRAEEKDCCANSQAQIDDLQRQLTQIGKDLTQLKDIVHKALDPAAQPGAAQPGAGGVQAR